MGCDIHAHFEIKVDGEWLHYSQPKIKRSYALFEKMAGVRGDVENALCAPRGLPNDISKTTEICANYDDVDGHTHSWIGADEVAEVISFIEKQSGVFSVEADGWGYMFGNGWDAFSKYRNDCPDFLQDIRLVFWFDN